MATTAVTDTPTTTSLLSLPSEERRKILLESLREGYPCIPKVSRPVSSRVSRYVSQFTSGRWRERIWFSDESVDSVDLESEKSSRETEEPQLVIFGHNLHSEDYLKEREMMARWNIVERELHFPDLEKGYVQKRDAKTQSDVVLQPNIQTPTTKDADVVTEPTTDVPMEEYKESSQKVAEGNGDSPPVRGLRSSVGSDQTPQKVTKDKEDSPTGRGLKSSVRSIHTPTTNVADVVTEPTAEDVPMEECKESPQKVTIDSEDSPTGRGLRSSVESDQTPQKVTKDNEDSPPGRGLKSSVGSNQTPATNDADVVTEPTTDVSMEECKVSPQKVTEDNQDSPTGRGLKSSVTEDNENSPTGRGLKSSVVSDELDSKVEEMQDGNEIVDQASATSDQESKPLGPESKAPEEIQSATQHESSVPPEDEERQGKMATASEDSKDDANSSTEMKTPEAISNEESPLEGQSVSNTESSASKDVKGVPAAPDPKRAEIAKTETSDANSAESGAKTSDPNSKSSALLEAKEAVEKMETSTIPEDSRVESSEKVLETPTTTSTLEKSVPVIGSSNVAEVKESVNKMDTENVPEQTKVARTSETDAESSGTNLRGKRKADSVTEDDPDEKRTKKTSAE